MSQNAALGSALTFFQLIFIAAQSLPSFIDVDTKRFPPRLSLKPRAVPLYLWLACVVLLTGVSLLNNWAFAFHVPVSLQILIRSAGAFYWKFLQTWPKLKQNLFEGLGVAMCMGYFFSNKRYTRLQVVSETICHHFPSFFKFLDLL